MGDLLTELNKNDLKISLVREISDSVTRATGHTTELPTLMRANARDLATLMMALKRQEVRQ